MVEIEGLVKSYKSVEILNIGQLVIHQGESFGLVGNNGAGKTTLFRIILDLIRANAGEVRISGSPVQLQEDWKSFTGSFIDEKFLLAFLTPDEYFSFLANIYGMNSADLNNYLDDFEVFFNGEIRGKKKYIRDLSKGNKKKVGIAAAFMGNPTLVILDEPFENLDPTSQIHLKRLIKAKTEGKEMTFLISSHDLNHVTEICTRIVLLEKGRILLDENVNKDTLIHLNDYFGGNAQKQADQNL